MKKSGFTLIELMVVVAIIGILALFSVPQFTRYIAKAKRAEAYINLRSIYAAQKAHFAEHGSYAQLSDLRWSPDGYENGNASCTYSYGCGSAISGKCSVGAQHASQGSAGKTGFVAVAAADIDGDGQPDIISIDHTNTIKIIRDDLT